MKQLQSLSVAIKLVGPLKNHTMCVPIKENVLTDLSYSAASLENTLEINGDILSLIIKNNS